jgi:primosomal protein N' (replication factor Y)
VTDLIARIMIDSALPQLDRLFDYRVPATLAPTAAPGVRVRVPLRSAGRIADGFIVELVESGSFAGTLSDIDSIVSPLRVLAPEVWALARAVADRAAGTASDVVRLAVPKRQVRVEKAAAEADQPTIDPVTAVALAGYDFSLSRRARVALDAVPRLAELPDGEWVGEWAVTMAALATQSLAAGGSAILAVPDYRDQRQLIAALSAVLPASRIVHLDAKQSNPDRYRALLACLQSTPLAIVGNRSVVYAPAAELGLIAVWDDGDPLHSEPLSPYVHTRDAALVRQEQQGSALVFLGHSRSTDVERLVEIGWMQAVSAERTYLPKVIPTAQQSSQDRLAAQARIPSSAWREARAALQHGPVLVQVARPGYAPRLACASCGESARCAFCEGPLSLATSGGVPACQWCGRLAAAWSCSNCDGTKFRNVGQGAGRTAEDLGRAFPGVRIILADGERGILTVGSEPALVIATRGAEPIAAGGYRAILLLDGERMLARESLRVAEDCLRWWSNAIALAAPGAPTVIVGVGGPLASALTTWRLASYARRELDDRRRLRFPPAVRVATVTGDTASVERAIGALTLGSRLDVLGPVDVPEGGVRAIVRFDFAEGATVASTLRAAVVTNATTRRRRIGATSGAGARPALPTLKVRFDDSEPFDQ